MFEFFTEISPDQSRFKLRDSFISQILFIDEIPNLLMMVLKYEVNF